MLTRYNLIHVPLLTLYHFMSAVAPVDEQKIDLPDVSNTILPSAPKQEPVVAKGDDAEEDENLAELQAMMAM